MIASIKTSRALLLALALLIAFCSATALAAVDVNVQADKTSLQQGDMVEVTITVKGTGMSIAEGSFAYDPAILAFEEGEGGVSDGLFSLASAKKGGEETLVARIRFAAVGAGTAEVAVALDKVTGYDGKEQQGASTSISISVAAATATPAPTPISYAKEGVPAQNVKDAAEPLYIWRTLENVTVPSGYAETTLSYHGETVASATVDDSGAPTLLYLSNDTGETGGYYIYESRTDTLYPYRTVSSISKSYILLEPDGSVGAPEGFQEATLTIGEKEYPAWSAADAQGETYLLYARNPDGEVGYYYYNPEDESLQRYSVLPARPIAPTLPQDGGAEPAQQPAGAEAPGAEPAGESGKITLSRTVFFLICGAAALLLIAFVWLFIVRVRENARRERRIRQRLAERARELDEDVGG